RRGLPRQPRDRGRSLSDQHDELRRRRHGCASGAGRDRRGTLQHGDAMRALGLALASILALSATAEAQDGPELLQDADAAYSNVDFEHARASASSAIETGGLSPTELVHAYQLVGVSASALGDSAAAREAFVMMV